MFIITANAILIGTALQKWLVPKCPLFRGSMYIIYLLCRSRNHRSPFDCPSRYTRNSHCPTIPRIWASR